MNADDAIALSAVAVVLVAMAALLLSTKAVKDALTRAVAVAREYGRPRDKAVPV